MVAVFGAGPIGLMTARWAMYRGARTVFIIDSVPDRLALAENLGCVVINDQVQDLAKELPPVDVAVDCVGETTAIAFPCIETH